MQLADYQEASARTLNPAGDLKTSDNYLLGVIGEAGEVVELIKKATYHQHVLDLPALARELGDVCWYLAAIATEVGTTLQAAQQQTQLLLHLLDALPLSTKALRLAAYAVELNVVVGDWRLYRNPLQVAAALGSVLRAVQAICYQTGIPFGAVLSGNVSKLKARYPLAFDVRCSIHRVA